SMETHRRCFTSTQREYLRLRDQVCATPYCEAPIRHADHTTPNVDGGPTTLDNGQSLCEACNYAKQATGRTPHRPPHRTIPIPTPTGPTYTSRAPDLPGARAPNHHDLPADLIHPSSVIEVEYWRLAG